MTMHTECVVMQTALPPGYNFAYQTTEIGNGVINPGTTSMGGMAPRSPRPGITPADILDAQQGKKLIYIWGWIRYFDIFPNTKEHITRFCWIITPIGNPIGKASKDNLRFDYLTHNEGNCSDDDCYIL
jgi:hypothetical protein